MTNEHTQYTIPAPTADYAMAYVLWLVGGLFGIHRFYLQGPRGLSIVMFLLPFFLIGFIVNPIWWLIDLFLIEDLYKRARFIK